MSPWIFGAGTAGLGTVGIARVVGPGEGSIVHSILSGVAVVGAGMLLSLLVLWTLQK